MKRNRFRQFVIGHFRRVKLSLFLAGLCTLALSLTQLLSPWPIKIIFDHVLLAKKLPDSLSFLSGITGSEISVSLTVLCGSMVLISVLKGIFSYLQLYITARIGNEAVYNLRKELFTHLQRLSLSFHNRARSGELMTKIASDTNTLRDVLADSALDFVAQTLTLVGTFVIMFAVNWKLALVAVATFPFLAGALAYRIKQTRASARRSRKLQGQMASRMAEVLTSMPLVQAFGREEYEEGRFDADSAQSLRESLRTARIGAAAARIVEFVSALGTGATLLFGSLQVVHGAMMPGELLLFMNYLSSMYRPLRGLAKLGNEFSKASVSAERVAEILDVEPEIQDSPDAINVANLKGEIVYQNVSFDYGDGKAVLRNVSFLVSPGQRVALVGASGAGKSTIVSLLLRFYEPQEGTILIDGVDIKNYNRESLRREIGIVLQNSVLFGATIKENIAYGKLDASMDEIVAAAKAANAHGFISDLEDGYDTIIGERASTLSGGQRQRIAIARAIIRNAHILILDELTTGLDKENERAVLEALERLSTGRTTFLISHDLRLASRAGLILFLEDGQVLERGTHADLVRRQGSYATLYKLQATAAERVGLEEGRHSLAR